LDSLGFREFISADSARYLRADSTIKFVKTDSVLITDNQKAIVLKMDDPGAYSSLAMVAYIDAVSEIVIYELNISQRRFHAVGTVKFEEALSKFSFVK
jgi:hypothetical protein